MSQLLIQHYLNELQTLRRVSGTSRESVVREAFKTLLKDWGRSQDLIFIPEYEYATPQKTRVYPDGALLHALRVPLGYWEAKDEEDDLDDEIEKKFRKGYALEETFFTGKVKYDTLASLRSYYAAIKSAAALVSSHHEKQNFLKTIYENFYKVYDKKKADRLGVVYTPNEIVRFMIESADWLCDKHFGKSLIDKQVEILDPACGTGTFITELVEHFRGQPQKLRYKYLEEVHANEVAILPYYVANLNIEATYAAINGYEEYPNLCFVDTLDNVAALRVGKGQHYGDLLGALSDENVKRIKRQNERKISVFIGNPPYNANQLNENNNNKNRTYPRVDEQVKATYVAASAAQKTAVYDMYARFFRWATDRLQDEGIIAFITNRSFIDSRTFDGFRRGKHLGAPLALDIGPLAQHLPLEIAGRFHLVASSAFPQLCRP